MLRLLTTKSLDNLLFFLPLLAIHIFLSVSYSLILLCSTYDKIKAPQILHGRNTLQKYVENRELTKNTHKVLKIKEY